MTNAATVCPIYIERCKGATTVLKWGVWGGGVPLQTGGEVWGEIFWIFIGKL